MNYTKDFPIISGTVTDGQGQASGFTALGWLQNFFEKDFGFTPYPGTLNLIATGEMPPTAQFLDIGTRIAAPTPEFCDAQAIPVKIDHALQAVWIIPLVSEYPHQQIELIADRSLRGALNLKNGDPVTIQIIA